MFVEVLVFLYCKCCACSKSGQQNDNLLPIRYLNVKILKRHKSKEKMSSKNQKLDIFKKVKMMLNLNLKCVSKYRIANKCLFCHFSLYSFPEKKELVEFSV